MSLRGWGRLLRPTAPDPSLASGQTSIEKAQARAGSSAPEGQDSFRSPWRTRPLGPLTYHNPGSREIGNRRRAGGEWHLQAPPPSSGRTKQSSRPAADGLGAGGQAVLRPEFQARNHSRAGLGTQCSRARDAGTPGSRPCQAAPHKWAEAPQERTPGGLARTTRASEVDPLVPVDLVGEDAAEADGAVQRGLVEHHGALVQAQRPLSHGWLREE